ncbi:MAG: hypothetical protein HC809_09555 [Gammaproteobacteria bacterium]|nr:hypothetical protein [Gammaproteobacteria bacterium]
MLSLLNSFHVAARDDELILPSARGPVRYVEIDDDLFASIDGRRRIAFSHSDGPAEYLYPEPGVLTLRRVAPQNEPLVQWGIAAGSLAILALVVVWPVSTFRHRGRNGVRGEAGATLLAMLTSVLLIGFAVIIAAQVQDSRSVLFGLSEVMQQALWVPVAASALLLLQLVATYRAWVRSYWWVLRRIHYTLATFAGIAFVAWLNHWHLLAVTVDF